MARRKGFTAGPNLNLFESNDAILGLKPKRRRLSEAEDNERWEAIWRTKGFERKPDSLCPRVYSRSPLCGF